MLCNKNIHGLISYEQNGTEVFLLEITNKNFHNESVTIPVLYK